MISLFNNPNKRNYTAVFVDYEHWFYSMKHDYHTKPEVTEWMAEIGKDYELSDIKELVNYEVLKSILDSTEEAKLHDNVVDPIMEFEPDMHNVLQKVVPMYITNIIYQALLEAQASELASRMTAMSAATTNAEKIIHNLSIEYNKTRQFAITQEIIEVVSGANAQAG